MKKCIECKLGLLQFHCSKCGKCMTYKLSVILEARLVNNDDMIHHVQKEATVFLCMDCFMLALPFFNLEIKAISGEER